MPTTTTTTTATTKKATTTTTNADDYDDDDDDDDDDDHHDDNDDDDDDDDNSIAITCAHKHSMRPHSSSHSWQAQPQDYVPELASLNMHSQLFERKVYV